MISVERDSGLTGGVGAREMTDAERRLADIIKTGKVIETKYGEKKSPRVKVIIGDPDDDEGHVKTGWLPLLGLRAGNGDSEWNPPEVGEVVTIMSESGEFQNGFVLPGSIYNEDNPAPGDKVGLWRKRFKDGTVIEYDRDEKKLNITGSDDTTITTKVKDATVTTKKDSVEVKVSDATHTVKASNVETRVGGSYISVTDGKIVLNAEIIVTVGKTYTGMDYDDDFIASPVQTVAKPAKRHFSKPAE